MWTKRHMAYRKGCDDMEDIIPAESIFFFLNDLQLF